MRRTTSRAWRRAAIALLTDPALHQRIRDGRTRKRLRYVFSAGLVVPMYEAYYERVGAGVVSDGR